MLVLFLFTASRLVAILVYIWNIRFSCYYLFIYLFYPSVSIPEWGLKIDENDWKGMMLSPCTACSQGPRAEQHWTALKRCSSTETRWYKLLVSLIIIIIIIIINIIITQLQRAVNRRRRKMHLSALRHKVPCNDQPKPKRSFSLLHDIYARKRIPISTAAGRGSVRFHGVRVHIAASVA